MTMIDETQSRPAAIPIEGYDSLKVASILPRLATLGADDLRSVRRHEVDGKYRVTVVRRIDELLEGAGSVAMPQPVAQPQDVAKIVAPWETPAADAPKKSARTRLAVGAALLLIVLGAVGATALKSAGNSKPGFMNPTALEADMKTTVQHALDDPNDPKYSPGSAVTDVSCINAGGRNFTCIGSFDDGEKSTAEVTVSADGQSWISK